MSLEDLKRQRRLLISEMNDAVDNGHLATRQRILDEVIELENRIRAIETPVYKNTGAIHTDKENDHYLLELQKAKNALHMEAEVDIDRRKHHNKVSEYRNELIKAREELHKEANQHHKPWWKFW